MRRPTPDQAARAAAAAAACAVLWLAGCGGEDDGPGRTVTVTERAIEVVGDEYSFDPETIVTTPGTLSILLRNEGTLAHNLKVFEGDREIGGTPTFQAGRERGAIVQLFRGEYDLVCTVGNHADLGMVGKLRVE